MTNETPGGGDKGSGGEKAVDMNAPLIPKVPPPSPRAPQSGDNSGSGDGGSNKGQQPKGSGQPKRRRRRGRGKGGGQGGGNQNQGGNKGGGNQNQGGRGGQKGGGGGNRQQSRNKGPKVTPVEALMHDDADPIELDDEALEKRRGRQRKGRAVGRYQMNVHTDADGHTHIAVLEGRSLIEHYVARPADDISQIHGNIYVGRVENVLPGMEAAFIDIGTPKNAVLYRGDISVDPSDVEKYGNQARIEQVLKRRQTIVCQVTKNPIGHKGARLTQEVSLPGRFVVLVPNSTTFGISKRLPDKERKRLRNILDGVKPKHHGVIVRTAAENVTAEEIERDVGRLVSQWDQIEALAKQQNGPALLYREPDMAVRVIREEFNKEYRAVIIDDEKLYNEVHGYVAAITPALAERVELYDPGDEKISLYERFQITEQLRKGLDRKVWLPSGGSLIIEHTEALSVIDVNTGRNVGSKNLEDTVFDNNLEAAVEIARQLRLRDIGGIIVVDFVDMEKKANRDELVRVFRDALSRDKTRTQVYNVSDLGLVEMTRKRIGEGLLESFSSQCEVCEGRGVVFNSALLGNG